LPPVNTPLFLLAALLGAMGPAHAAAPPAEARTEQVAARLLAPVTRVQPGQALQLGVQQRIVEHWHTYWLNPGDSGLATTIAWQLPPGASAGPIEWPTPTRFQVGPIVNHGYAGEVTLLSSVQVPAALKPGDTFRVQATVDWLVCQDSCIPQQVVLGLALPVGATATPGPDAAAIAQARSRLPAPAPGPAQWQRDGQALRLQMNATLPPHDGAHFFAARWGQLTDAAPQTLHQAGGWRLAVTPGESPPAPGEAPTGVLVLSRGGQPVQAYALGALPSAAPGPSPQAPAAAPAATGLPLALGLALLGGLVLNLMPCVFPVLSIKALSLLSAPRPGAPRQTPRGGQDNSGAALLFLASQAGTSRRSLRLHGLAYVAGVQASFLALAGVLIGLKAGGESVGWGFQFQSPAFVLLLALLMFGVGLSLSGVFSFGASVTGVGSSLADKDGLTGSFFTGVLATVVATPCTAPFMGAALGYALTQPAPVTLAVFASLGLGLALPYALLCEWPALQRRLPRPGAWMAHLKQALAFPMYGSAAWLAWVLAQQAGTPALAVALAAAVVLAFAAWLFDLTQQAGRRLAGSAAAAIALVALVGGAVALDRLDSAASAPPSAAAGWEPYSPDRLQALRAQGKPVFVNLTADWCLTCLVNERVALGTDSVESAFAQAGVTRLKGDWTRRDERITRLLAEHGRSGVPLYLYFPAGAGSEPQVLPQLLSPALVLAALNSNPLKELR
jgi:thiol:disulfide interchange protein DsbD